VVATTAAAETSSPPAAADPLEVLSKSNPIVAPLVQGFSFLAIATSYIGFILGLTDFLADVLRLPSGRQAPLPYLLTLLPPFAFAMTYPNVFLKSLDVAGEGG
jgi:tyrosine-specific transport protein